ncbi:uncharacterized protein YecE (DUF72 family) [Pseudomonas sp. BP8]|nr:uncharacterized protein YecE (DUF72 family) [Pseudomonas sp. BP8]
MQRYAARLNAVEINSSFYRPHRPATYARWASSVPEQFRFSVKVPKTITHVQRLQSCETLLDGFIEQCSQLGDRLGCLLVQLPPSLDYDADTAQRFFERLRERYAGGVAVEPRHVSWQVARPMLVALQIAQVAASPPRFDSDALPGGWPGLVYWRLHGQPRLYHSEYSDDYLQRLAQRLHVSEAAKVQTWCIFDNTASGAALANALAIQALING